MQLLVGFECIRLPAAAPSPPGRKFSVDVAQLAKGIGFPAHPAEQRKLVRVRCFTVGCKGRVGVLRKKRLEADSRCCAQL